MAEYKTGERMEIAKNFQSITIEELDRWLKSGEELVLVHTLPPEDFNQQRLPQAINVCVYEMTFIDQIHALGIDHGAKLVVYGSSARSMDAVTAAGKLMRDGYAAVYVLSGGREAWVNAGYAVEGDGIAQEIESVPSPLLTAGHYTLDLDASGVEWTGRNPNGKHYGTLQLAGGALNVAEGAVRGAFELDMTSIRNTDLEGDEMQSTLIEHLLSDDFFFVERFSRAYFTLEEALPLPEATSGQPNYRVRGSLELRGIRLPLELTSTLSAMEGDRFVAQAHFDWDRTLWGVVYGSSRFFERLGMHLVFDAISLELRMVFHKASDT